MMGDETKRRSGRQARDSGPRRVLKLAEFEWRSAPPYDRASGECVSCAAQESVRGARVIAAGVKRERGSCNLPDSRSNMPGTVESVVIDRYSSRCFLPELEASELAPPLLERLPVEQRPYYGGPGPGNHVSR